MSTKPKLRPLNLDAPRIGPGIYTLADLKERCAEIGDCWEWRVGCAGNGQPMCYLPPSVLADAGRKPKLPARRAAWLLAGRPMREGWMVWNTCGSSLCVNPAHSKAGTRAEWGAWVKARGEWQGVPQRKAAGLKHGALIALSQETVRAIQGDIAAGLTRREIAARRGVHIATVSRINVGRHIHVRQAVLPAASIFAMGGAR